VCTVREVPIMEPFNFQRYPLSFMFQDALILLTPVLLTLIGFLFME
jgi:hypothetical protein